MFKSNKKNIKDDDLLLLSPQKIDNDVTEIYIKELKKAIEKEGCCNVALSGSYGTGKSTIIMEFLDKYNSFPNIRRFLTKKHKNGKLLKIIENHNKKKNKYIVITIGSFLKQREDNNNRRKNNNADFDNRIDITELELVEKIERSILKQLIYRNTSSKMPNSSIKRLSNNCFKIINTFLLAILSLFLIAYWRISYIKDLFVNISSTFKNIFLIIYFLLLSTFIYQLIRKALNKISIKSIKYADYSIKFNNEENLAFNRELYELMYFFKKNKPKAIFFEDIDRFPRDIVMKVIEELKELNTIANIVLKEKVTFIYSFKDDIFNVMEERSKFYDYIISIMPISTSYNSIIQLYNLIEKKNIEKSELSNTLITIVAKYITDMRTLICIVNDYASFKKILNTGEHEKLFAMCVFKNYYIKDYTAISKSDNLIRESLDSTEDKKASLLKANKLDEESYEAITKKNREKLLNEKKDFIEKNENGHSVDYITLGSSTVSIEEFEDYNFDCNRMKKVKVAFNYYGGKKDIDRKDISEFLSNIKNIQNDERKKKEYIEKSREEIMAYDVKTIFRKYFQTNTPTLLDELIMNGYIDYDYVDFITSPTITDKLTSSDNKFMLDVQHNVNSFDTHIDNPKEIIYYLSSYFDKKIILNYDLINYLMFDTKSKEQLDKIIFQFNELDKDKLDFLFKFYKTYYSNYDNFLQLLCNNNISLFDNFIKCEVENKRLYEKFIITSIIRNIDATKVLFDVKRFSQVLINSMKNNYSYYDELLENEITRKNFKRLDFKVEILKNFSYENQRFLYDNSLYKLDKENITYITHGTMNRFDLKTLSKDDRYLKLAEYIKQDFKQFFSNYYANSSFILNDSDFIEKILSSNDFDNKLKSLICSKEKFTTDLKRKESNLYASLCDTNHIKPNWNNVVLLRDVLPNKKLVSFIYDNSNVLITSKNIEKIDLLNEECVTSLTKKFVNDGNYDKAILILSNTTYADNLKFGDISKFKKTFKNFCIENNFVSFNKKNTKTIIEESSKFLILKYFENFYSLKNNALSICKLLDYDKDLIKLLLQSKDILDLDKLNIINKMYLKNSKNTKLVVELMQSAFRRRKTYKVESSSNIVRNIFNNMRDYLSLFEIEEKVITFILK